MTSGVRRLLWFAALWAAGVIAVGAVAYLLRLVLQA
ncbi:MAG: DUF2474 family protein [Pseudomonadota bacterium]|nr:DUF2474 family protein [Pseudomonadota bacterium]